MIAPLLRCAVAISVLGSGALSAADWPGWLGPERTGVQPDGTLKVPSASVDAVWTVPLEGQKSHATVLIADGVVYVQDLATGRRHTGAFRVAASRDLQKKLQRATSKQRAADVLARCRAAGPWADVAGFTTWAGTQDFSEAELALLHPAVGDAEGYGANRLLALDLETGAVRWEQTWDSAIDNNGGAHATGLVREETLFVVDGAGVLQARSTADGSLTWSADVRMQSQYAGPNASVVAHGPHCYLLDKRGVWCFAASDGSVVWRTEPDENGVAATEDNTLGLMATDDDVTLLVPSLGYRDANCLVGVDGADGAIRWRLAKGTAGRYTTPLVAGDVIVTQVAAELVLHRLQADAEPTAVARIPKPMDRKTKDTCATPVVHDGKAWLGNDQGTHCIDLATGDILWQSEDAKVTKNGSMVLVNGHLVASGYDTKGWLVIDAATGSVKHRQSFPKGLEDRGPRASLAVADGRVVMKLAKGVACYDLR